MNAFAHHFGFEFKTGLRNPTLLLMNYLFPLVFYVMMGFVMVPINPAFNDVLIPAIVIFAIMVSNLLGLPGPLVESREAGIYRSFKINGVPAFSILFIPMLTTIFHSLIVSAIIALTANLLFGSAVPTNWIAFALITLLTAFAVGALGALIGVVATNSRSVVLYSQLIFLPSMLVGGLMIPISMLPASVRWISGLLPTTYAMEAMNGLAYGRQTFFDPWISLAVLAGCLVMSLGLALFLFNWDSQNKVRRGHPLMALLALLPFVLGIFLAQ